MNSTENKKFMHERTGTTASELVMQNTRLQGLAEEVYHVMVNNSMHITQNFFACALQLCTFYM